MPLVTVKVDEELKDKMERHVEINWSETLRAHIAETIEERQRANIGRALLLMEEVRKLGLGGPDSTEIVRAGRDSRYGPRGR